MVLTLMQFCLRTILLLLYLSSFPLMGQRPDSLLGEWNQGAGDTNQVLTGLHLTHYYLPRNPPLALSYLDQTRCLADSLDFLKGQFNTRVYEIAYYQTREDRERCWELAQTLLPMVAKNGSVLYRQRSYQELANASRALSRPETETYFQEALKLSDTISLPWESNRARYYFATWLVEQNRYDEAAELLQKVLDTPLDESHRILQATAYSLMGKIWLSLADYGRAKTAFLHSLALRQTQPNPSSLAHVQQSLGILYSTMGGQLDSARIFLLAAMENFRQAGNLAALPGNHNNLAQLYQELDSAAQARYHFQAAIKAYRFAQSNHNYLRTLSNLGAFEVQQGNTRRGLSLLQQAETQADSLGIPILQQGIYLNLYKAYETVGHYSRAYHYKGLYHTLKDSLLEETNRTTIAEIEVRYEHEKKER